MWFPCILMAQPCFIHDRFNRLSWIVYQKVYCIARQKPNQCSTKYMYKVHHQESPQLIRLGFLWQKRLIALWLILKKLKYWFKNFGQIRFPWIPCFPPWKMLSSSSNNWILERSKASCDIQFLPEFRSSFLMGQNLIIYHSAKNTIHLTLSLILWITIKHMWHWQISLIFWLWALKAQHSISDLYFCTAVYNFVLAIGDAAQIGRRSSVSPKHFWISQEHSLRTGLCVLWLSI